MKRICIVIVVIRLLMCLSSCSNQNSENNSGTNGSQISTDQPRDIVKSFFDAFEKADYDTMKEYCTKECVDSYFHDKDVFGMVWAKPVDVEIDSSNENQCKIFVTVEMETAENSALYGESKTSFYVVLNKTDDDSWVIHSFVTG